MPCAFSNGTYILQLKTLFYIKPKILQEVIHCVYKVLEDFCLVLFSLLNNLALRKSGSKALTTSRKGRQGVEKWCFGGSSTNTVEKMFVCVCGGEVAKKANSRLKRPDSAPLPEPSTEALRCHREPSSCQNQTPLPHQDPALQWRQPQPAPSTAGSELQERPGGSLKGIWTVLANTCLRQSFFLLHKYPC